jgi:hypothetical protein
MCLEEVLLGTLRPRPFPEKLRSAAASSSGLLLTLGRARPSQALANQSRQAAATIEAAQLELASVGEHKP